MQPIVLVLLSVFLSVAGQLFLKTGMGRIGPLGLDGGPVRAVLGIARQPFVWGGLALYGVGTFFWLIALSRVQLSYAYPFLSLSYVLVLLSSWIVFREEMSWWRLGGVVAICLGVYAVAGGAV